MRILVLILILILILVLILVLVLVLVLQSPSLTLPRKMGRGATVLPQRGRLFTLGPAN